MRRRLAFFDTPEEVAKELVFWIHKHETLQAMLDNRKENLAYMAARGIYDRRAAARTLLPVVTEAVANYEEELGGIRQQSFPQDVGYMAAELLCDEFEQELEKGTEEPEVGEQRHGPKVEDDEVEAVKDISIPIQSGEKQIVINLNIAQKRAAARRTSMRQTSRRSRTNPFDRIARKKKKAQEESAEEHQPGQASPTLRRRMGNALADLFDEFGPDIYSEIILALKDIMIDRFDQGFGGLDQAIKEELGNRGVQESREYIRSWADEIVEDINHYGLDEVAGALEDHVGSLTAEFIKKNEEGEEVMEVGDELDVVEEEEVEPIEEPEAPTTEEPAAPEVPELNLDEVEVPTLDLGAGLGYRRARGTRRPQYRVARRR